MPQSTPSLGALRKADESGKYELMQISGKNPIAKARLEQAKECLSTDRPALAVGHFRAALEVSTDRADRNEAVVGLDEALLAFGKPTDAEALWKFELSRADASDTLRDDLFESACRAGRHDIALVRLSAADGAKSPEWIAIKKIKCLVNLFETEAAYTLVNEHSATMPELLKRRLQCQIMMAERRFREVLAKLSVGAQGRSIDLMQLRFKALIGTGQFAFVDQELQNHRPFYPTARWMDVELAHNATEARWRELAVSRWQALVDRDTAADFSFRGLIDALIANIELDRANEAVAAAAGRFNVSALALTNARVLMADGDLDAAVSHLQEAINDTNGEVSAKSTALLWAEKSSIELRKYQGTGDRIWLRRHLDSAISAREIDSHRYPQRIKVIDAHIRCGNHQEARFEIGQLPANNRQENLRLEMWKSDSLDDTAASKKIWAIRKRIHYVPQIEDGPYANLKRVDENRLPPEDGLALYTAVKDELNRLPWFLSYYRKLGVRNFIFVDNSSTDGSISYLREQTDVTLYSTNDSYVGALAGMVWLNFLKNRLSRFGWALYADVDEALVYDECEKKDLQTLIDLLETEDAEAMTGYMLDMFSPDPGSQPFEGVPTDYIARYPYYLKNLYRNPAPVCPYQNVRGGARTVFGTGEELTKTPLVKVASGIDFLRSSHNISPARISRHKCVFLHYKLVDGLTKEAQAVLIDRNRSADCQLRYRKYLEMSHVTDLLTESLDEARRFRGSAQLVADKVISRIDAFHTDG